MGMTGALKMSQIVGFVERILAIEFLAAAEGVEHRRPLKSSPVIETLLLKLREVAPKVTEDRALGIDIESVANKIRAKRFTS